MADRALETFISTMVSVIFVTGAAWLISKWIRTQKAREQSQAKTAPAVMFLVIVIGSVVVIAIMALIIKSQR